MFKKKFNILNALDLKSIFFTKSYNVYILPVLYSIQKKIIKIHGLVWFGLWFLMPLSKICQLYGGCQNSWGNKKRKEGIYMVLTLYYIKINILYLNTIVYNVFVIVSLIWMMHDGKDEYENVIMN